MAKKIILSQHARMWIEDRIENEDPLLWGEFVKMMREIGETAVMIKKYRSAKVKNAAKKLHKDGIAYWKRHHRLGR
jgi:hypothetical protein